MADDSGNEDQWLYGDATESIDNDTKEKTVLDSTEENVDQSIGNDNADDSQDQGTEPTEKDTKLLSAPEPASIAAPSQQDGEEEAQSEVKDEANKENGAGDDDDDSDEDDVHVIINDIKSGPTYTSLNIKRGGLLTSSGGVDKLKQPGKFSIEEFEAVGSINGVPAHEFNLDSVEDKPWRKPGADITDYFNYGFNEDTWRAYCERQKRLRIHESGVGLAQLGSAGAGRGIIPVSITNDNSKYSGFMGPKKAGPPPGRKMAGMIDVIGVGGLLSRRNEKDSSPKENVIQVMTADRREYSRKPFPDMSVPPPATFDLPPPPHGVIASSFPPPPGQGDSYGPDFYSGEPDPYYQAYEPTQDSQWNDTAWQSSGHGAKVMTPRTIVTTVSGGPADGMSQDSRGSEEASVRSSRRRRSPSRMQDEKELLVPGTEKESRDRNKDRSERGEKERHRERSHRRRDRSRSRSTERRSRKHKSRSRSPGHRSHRKKKSRHAEREKSKEDTE